MDITPIFVFVLIHLLPADIKSCKAITDNNEGFQLIQIAPQTWKFQRKDDASPRTFLIQKNKIKSLDGAEAGEIDVANFIDLSKIKWKRVNKIVFKDNAIPTFGISRGMRYIKLISKQNEQSQTLTIVY